VAVDCCAPLYKEEDRFVETYFKRFGPDTYLVGDAAPPRPATATSG